MEGVGARFGRSSSRYSGPAVFTGPVRKWKKAWVHTTSTKRAAAATSSSSPSLSSSRTTTRDASSSQLLLYKWMPVSQSSNDTLPPPPPHRKFRYVPVSLMEEKEDAAANTDEEIKPNGDGTTDGKPDVYDSRIEECQASDEDQPAMGELSKRSLDLNLGWKSHNRDNSIYHSVFDQAMGWTE